MKRNTPSPHQKSWLFWLAVIGLLVLMALPRLTALNRYRIVDESDRWRWAENFVLALNEGDLSATLVGDGYPGIVPVWAESIWVLGEAARRSLAQGQWLGDAGLYKLFHEWDRTDYLYQQRLPIVLLNTALALAVVGVVWRLFGGRVALLSGLLIGLDPFYLSDSRVNRAEALITGLMTLSVLFLIFYARKRQLRYAVVSGIFGGLSFLTKIQALAMLPALGLIGLMIYVGGQSRRELWPPRKTLVWPLIRLGLVWTAAALATWFILWPAMWVVPLETLTLVYNYTTRKVGAEGVKLFFMGETFENVDPGPIFYPFVLLMRSSPLTILGLAAAALFSWLWQDKKNAPPDRPNTNGSGILLIYILAYTFSMTLGSHKQDRYLMPGFLALDILAAMGLVFSWVWLKEKLGLEASQNRNSQFPTRNPQFAIRNSLFTPTTVLGGVLLAVVIAVQLAVVLPHHPYYYSYFNPLFGGGATAVQTLRIGWGEGMDQAGAYLAAKPNAERLVVSSRFTHNMLGFPGELISLGADGRWTKADYIVLYIQQVQRRLDPSPEFLDYFQARPPEKIITLGDLDYVWIYPIPFQVAANPEVSSIPDQAALLGYSWETKDQKNVSVDDESSRNPSPTHVFANPQIRLVWKNLGLTDERQLTARLTGQAAETGWAECRPDANFTVQAATSGALVESLCTPAVNALPAGLYTVEFGLRAASGEITPFLFPESWRAARLTAARQVELTPEQERLDALAAEAVPAAAQTVNHVYEGQIRLLAYRLEPPRPQPGEPLEATLYWQAVRDLINSANLTVQLSDSRSISLGRDDIPLFNLEQDEWFPGQIITSQHTFPLPPELDTPLAARIEAKLANNAKVALRPTTPDGEPLDAVVGRFTIAPETWPPTDALEPVSARWQNGVTLLGYTLSPQPLQPGEPLIVDLYWQTDQHLSEDLVAFVHLVDAAGQLQAQNDAIPRAGAYPTQWWQPGVVIEDGHAIALPPDLPAGSYQLLVGLYRSADGSRLLTNADIDAVPLAEITLP